MSCKHKSILQLLGHIQWLKNEKKNSPKTLPVPAVLWGFKLIEKELQTQVHPLAAGL
jgi:hypothetical protein